MKLLGITTTRITRRRVPRGRSSWHEEWRLADHNRDRNEREDDCGLQANHDEGGKEDGRSRVKS